MWKIVIGFIVVAGLALFLLNKGGDIDLGGEKHGELNSGPRMPLMAFAPSAGGGLHILDGHAAGRKG